MSQNHPLPRSPELMSAGDTALLVVDVQEKLVPAIAGHERIVWNVRRLIDGAKLLGLPVVATEQYPKGLGPTVPELAALLGASERKGTGSEPARGNAGQTACREVPVPFLSQALGSVPSKLTFSCGGCPELFEELDRRGIHKILVCGIEAHVCVQQTVLDLLAAGWRVFVAVDAVGSRFDLDYQTALRRMDSSGATLTTTESALFEWCETAAAPQFKEISRLAKEQGP